NKLNETYEVWQQKGKKALHEVADNEPAKFAPMVANLIPQHFKLEHEQKLAMTYRIFRRTSLTRTCLAEEWQSARRAMMAVYRDLYPPDDGGTLGILLRVQGRPSGTHRLCRTRIYLTATAAAKPGQMSSNTPRQTAADVVPKDVAELLAAGLKHHQ